MRSIFILLIALILSISACKAEEEDPLTVRVLKPEYVVPDAVHQIVEVSDSLVRPILYATIPSLDGLSLEETKTKFISAVLPAILVAKYQIEEDQRRIARLDTAENWSKEDSMFVSTQKERFGAEEFEDLTNRMKTHPNSIVLAQAIVESGWGNSRFFKRANNLFGIWSYRASEPRILAGKTRNGVKIYVRKYDDLSGSIIDYFGTVARTRAYRKFRAARAETKDVQQLLPYLKYYSERREAYVDQLRTIIRQNKLTRYDQYQIDPAYFVEEQITQP